jgi:UDP-galactose transporter B1
MGVFGLFTYYGYLQEALLSDKELALSVSFMICIEAVLSCLFSAIIIKVGDMGDIFASMNGQDLKVGLLNFFSKQASNNALKFVSYPFTVLAKSAKILPVIAVGTIRGVYKPNLVQAIIAISITSGLILFNSGKLEGLEEDSGNWIGISLVLLSLALDGESAAQTDKNQKETKRPFAY